MPLNLLLKCNNIQATKSYYYDVLKFEVRKSGDNLCTVEKDDCTLVFTSDDLWGGEPQFTGTLYFFVDNVEFYYNLVKDKVKIEWPLEKMPYGTIEFGVKDINGYNLAFAKKQTKY